MVEVISQRENYLKNLKDSTRKFWLKVVEMYNDNISPTVIASKFTNPRTGKPYSRQHIHAIIKKIREET